MKCIDCPYYWSETNRSGKPIDNPCCHYRWNDGYAPCEVEETEEAEEE